MGLFDKRVAFKPFEYLEVVKFKEAIQHSYWLVSEFNFTADKNDYKVRLSPAERSAIKNTLLAISQIEVGVKKFWGKLGDRFPKPEIEFVGAVFAESEVRHADAYSHLLEVLGLNDEFNQLLDTAVIQGRVDYLTKYLKGASDNSDEAFALTLTLFSIFIENVSLFSQFAIIQSFYRSRNMLKDVFNVVDATRREERVHALFGVYLLRLLKKEQPSWFNEDFYAKLTRACRKAYEAEKAILKWIFEAGELTFLPLEVLDEFIKDRFNESLSMIEAPSAFEVDEEKLSLLRWFKEDEHAESNTDFFHLKPVTYTKKTHSITAKDIF